jgi:hypothetical protein
MTAICALTDRGEIFCKMRVGINTGECMLEFLEELEHTLREQYGGIDENGRNKFLEYRRSLVVILDNASIHTDMKV